ncbi:MAG: hypothetical protein WCP34_16285, partial [Pseudomonadota bacterium]
MTPPKSDPTIIVAARQAGSAHAFAPVIRALSMRGYCVAPLAFEAATGAWIADDIPYQAITEWAEAQHILDALESPIFLLTGTSRSPVEDERLWDWARRHGVPSLAFVDHWVNYWERFSSSPRIRFDCLPDRIAVIDTLAARRMVEAGCPKECLIVTGHPGFDALVQYCGQRDWALRQSLMPADCDGLILFVSEPHSVTYGNAIHQVLGYTEHEALDLLVQCLQTVGRDTGQRWCVLVKPHPVESPNAWPQRLEAYVGLSHVLCRMIQHGRVELALAADLVVGMTSLLLYEAWLCGRPVLSVQPRARMTSDLVDGHSIPVVRNDAELTSALMTGWRDEPLSAIPSAFGG